ncbi:MAG: nicotinate mononucleotide-dependent phosphoribosyltransferase CobT [Candidatus Bathyarchaeia archaeon]
MKIRAKGIEVVRGQSRATRYLRRVWGRTPVFLFVLGGTATAFIPGITVAGANPDLVRYTPAADAELIQHGECRSITGVPATPDGKPTPAMISQTAIRRAKIPFVFIDAGTYVKPLVPYVSTGLPSPGGDIRTGRALSLTDVMSLLEIGKEVGENFSQMTNFVVIGESIPGGTTTALGVLLALGIDARGKVSSSMPNNPHEIKNKAVAKGMKKADIAIGGFKSKPYEALAAMGDPILATVSGIATGALPRAEVILAGGTQMAAVAALLSAMKISLRNLAVATTPYIIADKSSDLEWLMGKIEPRVPLFTADPGLEHSSKPGLRAFSEGFVKEGVGAGGAAFSAMVKTRGRITPTRLRSGIEAAYKTVVEERIRR